MGDILLAGKRVLLEPGQRAGVLEVRARGASCGQLVSMSVQLESVTNPNIANALPAQIARPIGILTYGVADVSQTVEFDWSNGVALSVGTDGMRLDCRNDAPPGEPPVTVSAIVCIGSTQRGPRVLRSYYTGPTIGPLQQLVFPVPRMAGEVTFIRQPSETSSFVIQLKDRTGFVQMDQYVAVGAQCLAMQVTNDISEVQIVQLTGVTCGRVVFALYF
jgi:hypothetical protein